MHYNGYTSWLEIDLHAIRNNAKRMMDLTDRPIMAIVKANAYGHGLFEVSRAAVQAGASWCGVARMEEAMILRQNGLTVPTLILGFTQPDCVPQAIANRISLTLYDQEIAQEYVNCARSCGGRLRVHLKVDSGMGRLGIMPEQAAEFIRWINAQPELDLEAVFTHFARADEPEVETTHNQIRRFDAMLAALEAANLRPPLVHAANSAGSTNYPEARYDMVRCGIALYGLQPSDESPLPEGFTPALTWKTRLTSLKMLPPGHGVSYGHQYVTHHVERIGSLAVGYADGFRRLQENEVLFHGKRIPIVGRVCMDQCMLNLDNVIDARIGDEAVLIGAQGNEYISAEEVAERWGTNNYEVVCAISQRVPRIYLHTEP